MSLLVDSGQGWPGRRRRHVHQLAVDRARNAQDHEQHHEIAADDRPKDPVTHEALLATAGLRRAEYIGQPAETLVKLYLRRRPLGIDLVRFGIAPAQAINLIRHASYGSFQPVKAIEQGGEFEGVDPLHFIDPSDGEGHLTRPSFAALAQGQI